MVTTITAAVGKVALKAMVAAVEAMVQVVVKACSTKTIGMFS